VTLHFAETTLNFQRLGPFQVWIEGTDIRREIDLFRDVGFRTPLEVSFDLRLERGPLEIRFAPGLEAAVISAIAVEKME
jgi:hypothetical protein